MAVKETDKRKELLRQAEAAVILQKREARKDFWAFCMHMDPKFFAKRPFLKIIALALMVVFIRYSQGVSYRIAISLPPRAGKSYIISLFIAWMLGHFPEESIMRNTCSDTLYIKLSYDTRDIIRSKRYADIFPEIQLKSDKQNVHGWSLTKARQVSYFGAGVGGTVIGFGASVMAITDDLYKSLDDALSDTNNEKVWRWKEGTHDSRIEGNCCQVDVGTRWSENDVIGRLEEMGKYNDIIRVPAMDENDETFCNDVHTTEYYRDLRSDMDESIWEAEYMQNPIEAKGLLFPKSELIRFKKSDLKGDPDGRIGACDVADTGDDDLCAPFGDIFGDKIFIGDVVFTKDAVEVTEPRLAQTIIDNRSDHMRIESNNGGRIFSNSVKKTLKSVNYSKCEIEARPTTKNKETRILMKSGWIKKHCVFLDESEYERGSDYDRFMKALTRYKREGGNKHDDAPDGMTILAEFFENLGLRQKSKQRTVARGAGMAR